MQCCAGYPFIDGGDTTFEVGTSRIKYGSGALTETAAMHASSLCGVSRTVERRDYRWART